MVVSIATGRNPSPVAVLPEVAALESEHMFPMATTRSALQVDELALVVVDASVLVEAVIVTALATASAHAN